MVFAFPKLHPMKHVPSWWLLLMCFSAFLISSSLHAAGSSMTASAATQGSEANALLKWKASFDKQSQALLSSWNGSSPCHWAGITCDESKSVSEVNLTSFELRGTLQSLNFSSLPNILTIDINNNSFYGTIPQQIGVLSNLVTLDISTNHLSGPIPKSVGNLSKLSFLDFSGNSLSGTFPSEIAKLANLSHLNVKGNSLSGNIPQEIWRSDNL